ncbi:C-type lectin domain family 2 member D-like isoform X2 [Elgaria multicarinata webbii]|uniref:C-type lectin domain family 2 member D-like isoform X2 n=1 Tax=Elgaria multicarinata webbii TaxID=159646 RepID=UPI002FCD32DD
MAAAVPKCIADQKYALAAAVLITVLLIAVIALAAKKTPPCAPCPPPIDAACPDGWVGYGGKCYYASEEERNWNISAVNCSSFDSTLAVIDSRRDLDFLMKFTRPFHFWIGLSREALEMPWRWPNGTQLKNWFPVRGGGLCGYINDNGLSSTRCSTVKNFLCSKDDACITRRKRDASSSPST